MDHVKEIDPKKTRDIHADTDQYGDGSEFTHYLGNDETKTEESSADSVPEDLGKVAYGTIQED